MKGFVKGKADNERSDVKGRKSKEYISRQAVGEWPREAGVHDE